MDVYLVPVDADRYELYCEVPDEPTEPRDPASGGSGPAGMIRRLKDRFSEMLADAERERRHGPVEQPAGGWAARVKSRTMRWVAESIAEQRLLWHLRRQERACLFYPDDLDGTRAITLLRQQLGRDFDKHRYWLIVDTLLFVASGLLFLLPGPNLVAYYFAFRMVGHFFSLRGARQGLTAVQWTTAPSGPLAELRRVIGLDTEERDRRVHDVAHALNLEHLVKFFERTAIRAS